MPETRDGGWVLDDTPHVYTEPPKNSDKPVTKPSEAKRRKRDSREK